jgi:sucrose phosphorylase
MTKKTHTEDSKQVGLQKAINLGYAVYDEAPDYARPLLEIPTEARERMFRRLRFLYGEARAAAHMPELERILKVHHAHKPSRIINAEKALDPAERFTEKDFIMITYGDLVKGDGPSPLATLHRFVNEINRGAINTLHILPFFPYSSDRGFAVVDFRRVDPRLGTWEDIEGIGRHYDLMFDGVLNHCSSRSEMFREYLNANPLYEDFFIGYDSPDDLTPDQRSKIFRPRTSDILTEYPTLTGVKYVWTTFSEDQIDLNFRNPQVLTQVIASLLLYVRRGADILRLDAVTYIWAEPGTECVHLPQTHEIVKLLRDVMDLVAPRVALLTETNVPHEDNISYFGDGYDQAHMVYNFSLPPLVLHTFYTENSTAISHWAQNLKSPSPLTTFFNILDTHDGIGLLGVKGILANEEIDHIIERAKANGSYISYKMTGAGNNEPYEINSTWWSAVNGDDNREDTAFQVKRYLASRSISLVLQGVPGIYTHGATGTGNDPDIVRRTGHNRDINRQEIDSRLVARDLKDPKSKVSLIRRHGSKLNLARTKHRAFHPRGQQRVFMSSPAIFTVLRISPEGDQHILTMTNVTSRPARIEISLSDLGVEAAHWQDLMGRKKWIASGDKLAGELDPYDVVWLMPSHERS